MNHQVLAAVAILLLSSYAFANAQQNATVTATGTGTVTIPTNIAQIVLGVQVTATNASQAQAQAAELSQNVISSLQDLNVSKLQTSSISLTQITNPSPSPVPTAGGSSGQNQVFFQASNQVSFQVPVDMAGEAIDAAVAAGANSISSVTLTASDANVTAAQQEATKLAVSNAISFGRLVLGQLGCEAAAVGTVTLSPLTSPTSPIVPGLATASSVTTPVLGGEQDITATVQVNLIQSCPASAIEAINNGITNSTSA